MKIAELRAKSKEELKDLVLSLKKEQFNLRMQDSTGQLQNKNRFKEVRRTIARAKTIMSEDPAKMQAPKAAKAPKAPKAPKAEAASKKETKKAPAKKAKKG